MRDARGAATAVLAASAATALLALAIFAGSRGLRDYDAALVTYTLGTLVGVFALSYRLARFLERPATRRLAARGLAERACFSFAGSVESLVTQRFIRARGRERFIAHVCLSWGTLLATAVTLPLVFGWLRFETRSHDTHTYRLTSIGVTLLEFHADSLTRHVLFNLLNVSAVAVMVGAGLWLRRRLRDRGARVGQRFVADVLPLLLLLLVAASGLLLTASAKLLGGRGYAPIALLHAASVIGTLLYVPFGKLFHVVQRPLHLAVAARRRADARRPAPLCPSCGEAFAGAAQLADLRRVLAEVGLDGAPDCCPACRRRLLGFAQGLAMGRS
jgi:hypothetical protein